MRDLVGKAVTMYTSDGRELAGTIVKVQVSKWSGEFSSAPGGEAVERTVITIELDAS